MSARKRRRKPWAGNPPPPLDETWYGFARLHMPPGVPGWIDEPVIVGPDLILGVREWIEYERPTRGSYLVVAWDADRHAPLPDWGTVVVRRGGGWVLRSSDGLQVYAPLGAEVVMLRPSGSPTGRSPVREGGGSDT